MRHLGSLNTDDSDSSLRAQIEARDEIIAIASHELKMPLTSILLKLDLLKTPSEGTWVSAAFLVDFERSVRRMLRLIDGLLDVTQLRSGKASFEPEEFDLSALVREVVQEFDPEPPARKPPIIVEASQVVRGKWDRSRISQVIANLMSNAVKYGEGRPVEIRVGFCAQERRARLEVCDQGMGIPDDLQAKIFERFERALAGARSARGLGLGLYVVKQIVEAHGGCVAVRSACGQGSRFTVELPLV